MALIEGRDSFSPSLLQGENTYIFPTHIHDNVQSQPLDLQMRKTAKVQILLIFLFQQFQPRLLLTLP